MKLIPLIFILLIGCSAVKDIPSEPPLASIYFDSTKSVVGILCVDGTPKMQKFDIMESKIDSFKIIVCDSAYRLYSFSVGLNYEGTYIEQYVSQGNTFPKEFILKMKKSVGHKYFIDNIVLVDQSGQRRHALPFWGTILPDTLN